MQITEVRPESLVQEQKPDAAVELSIDTFDELMFVSGALGDFILTHKEDLDSAKLEEAAELKNQIIDDVVELYDTSEHSWPRTYVVHEKELIIDALKAVEIRDHAVFNAEHDSRYDWLSDPNATHEAAVTARTYDSPTKSQLFRD